MTFDADEIANVIRTELVKQGGYPQGTESVKFYETAQGSSPTIRPYEIAAAVLSWLKAGEAMDARIRQAKTQSPS